MAKKYDIIVSRPNLSNEKNTDVFWASSGVYSFDKETHKTSIFKQTILHQFGNTSILVPVGYHEFLVDTYGENYMTPYNRSQNSTFSCAVTDEFVE